MGKWIATSIGLALLVGGAAQGKPAKTPIPIGLSEELFYDTDWERLPNP
ncbi:MAG TPA: hypothetical protein VKG24_00500 [Pseudolabrys sp.]|nr:hypothetical protein [Pseudolabrys sp.]